MKISRPGFVSLQLEEGGKQVLRDAGIEPEQALAAVIIDEDDRGLWMKIARGGALYWLLVRWSFVRSVEIPAAAPKTRDYREK